VCTELLSNQGDQIIRHHSLNLLIIFGKGAATASGAIQDVDHRPLDPSLGHVVDFQFGLLGALASRLRKISEVRPAQERKWVGIFLRISSSASLACSFFVEW